MAETCKPAVKKRGPRVTDAEIKEALTASRGILTVASAWIAKNKGKQIRHQSLSERISKSEDLQKARKGVDEATLDFAESKLYELLAKGDKTALIFYLKCKGKHRGWVERGEITAELTGSLNVKSIADLMGEPDDSG